MRNGYLEDDSLSWKAKGILSFILSNDGEWTVDGLMEGAKDGKLSIQNGLKELEAHGYLVRQPLSTNSTFYKRVISIQKCEGGKTNG